jgi:hypothetical protein
VSTADPVMCRAGVGHTGRPCVAPATARRDASALACTVPAFLAPAFNGVGHDAFRHGPTAERHPLRPSRPPARAVSYKIAGKLKHGQLDVSGASGRASDKCFETDPSALSGEILRLCYPEIKNRPVARPVYYVVQETV